MAIFEFKRFARVRIAEAVHRLCKRVDGNIWQLEDEATGRLSERTQDELLELLRVGELTYAFDRAPTSSPASTSTGSRSSPDALPPDQSSSALWNTAPERDRIEARRQLAYVNAALNSPRSRSALKGIVTTVQKERKDLRPPSVSTIKRWLNHFIEGGRDIVALLPRTKARGNRKPRIEAQLESILDEAIDAIYLSLERPTIQDTLDHAIKIVAGLNRLAPRGDPMIPLPTLRMIHSVLRHRDPYEICALRYGRQYAARKYHSSIGYACADRGLARVEIDHTPVNMMVIDERTFLPLGRPWLTAALDVRHRVCLGYALSFEPPSWLSVMRCLKHAILPKTYVAQSYPEVKGRWSCYGLMELVAMDNGREFHMQVLDDLADQYAITLMYCPVAHPWWKGGIERFLGTKNRGIAHGHAGTTFSDLFERGEYDSVSHACVTLASLHEMIHTWIIDFYHQRVHKTLGMAPQASWDEEMTNRSISLPTSAIELDEMLAIPDQRSLTAKGVEYDHLLYNSETCRSLLIRSGGKAQVDFRRPTDDVGYIYVLDPFLKKYGRVPVIDRFSEYASGLTKWQHSCCVRYAQKNYQGRNDIVALAEAKERVREIVSSALNQKKIGRKKNAARFQNASSRPEAPQPALQPAAAAPTATAPKVAATAPPSAPKALPKVPVATSFGYVDRPVRSSTRSST